MYVRKAEQIAQFGTLELKLISFWNELICAEKLGHIFACKVESVLDRGQEESKYQQAKMVTDRASIGNRHGVWSNSSLCVTRVIDRTEHRVHVAACDLICFHCAVVM